MVGLYPLVNGSISYIHGTVAAAQLAINLFNEKHLESSVDKSLRTTVDVSPGCRS